MANLLIIKELCASRKITIRKLAEELGLQDAALHKIMQKGTTSTDKLETIARILNVPVSTFFEKNLCERSNVNVSGEGHKIQSGSINIMVEQQEKEIEHLKALLREKERVLEEKERTINILLNQNK